MIIKFINFPYVFTDTEDRIRLGDIVNQPRVGDRLEYDSEIQLYKVYKQNDVSECVGGACGLDNIGV